MPARDPLVTLVARFRETAKEDPLPQPLARSHACIKPQVAASPAAYNGEHCWILGHEPVSAVPVFRGTRCLAESNCDQTSQDDLY